MYILASKKPKTEDEADEHVVESNTREDEGVQGFSYMSIITTVLIIAVVAVAVAFTLTDLGSDTDTPGNETTTEALAVVDGEPIMQEDLDTRHALLQATVNPMIQRQQTLQFLVEERALLQEAEQQGVELTEEEITQAEQELEQGLGASREQINQQLQQQGLSYQDLRTYYLNGLRTTKLIEEQALSQNDTTEEQLRTYYQNNTNTFSQPETAEVQQIILLNQNGTNVSEEIDEILNRSEDENFCDLVDEYSDDTQRRDCGAENITNQTRLDPAYVQEALNADVDEISSVETQRAGFVFRKVGQQEASTPAFEDVREQVEESYRNQQIQSVYQGYVEEVLNARNVEVYENFQGQQGNQQIQIQPDQ